MKKSLLALLCLLLLFTLVSCIKATYPFIHPTDEIDRIEIVDAEDIYTFTVKKTLSDEEKDEFLKQFQKIKFTRYIIGDPLLVGGECIKITYQSGDYEMVCHFWNEYVQNGQCHYGWYNCDQQKFLDLLNQFS